MDIVVGSQIRLKSLCQRAKNYMAKHGSTFQVLDVRKEHILVKCIKSPCRFCDGTPPPRWMRWFIVDDEVAITE